MTRNEILDKLNSIFHFTKYASEALQEHDPKMTEKWLSMALIDIVELESDIRKSAPQPVIK